MCAGYLTAAIIKPSDIETVPENMFKRNCEEKNALSCAGNGLKNRKFIFTKPLMFGN